MRILFVTPTFFPIVGGAEEGLMEIAWRLANRHTVQVLTPHIPAKELLRFGSTVRSEKAEKLEIVRFYDWITSGKSPLKKLWQSFVPPVSWSYVQALGNCVRVFAPDVINFHYLFPSALALRAAQGFSSAKTVLSLVSRTDVIGPDNKLFRQHKHFMINSIRCAGCCTALTPHMISGLPQDIKVEIIPYGADTDRFTPGLDAAGLRHSLGIKGETFVLFTAQRLTAVKRTAILIRALQRLKSRGKDVVLVIAGKGPEEARLREIADELGVGSAVHFAGFVPDHELPAYFALADLFLFASASETFGIVLAQALASGLPVVAVNSTCISEVLSTRDSLLLTDADPHAFTEAVEFLMQNPEQHRRLSQQARARALSDYNWDVITERFETLFMER